MKLTGKCKEDFDKWYHKTYSYNGNESTPSLEKKPYVDIGFYNYNSLMQYGVYVDFFDSVGIYVMSNMFSIERDVVYEFIGQVETISSIWNSIEQTRPEARTAAIEKANEIYNKDPK
jgi:hypothetical protein